MLRTESIQSSGSDNVTAQTPVETGDEGFGKLYTDRCAGQKFSSNQLHAQLADNSGAFAVKMGARETKEYSDHKGGAFSEKNASKASRMSQYNNETAQQNHLNASEKRSSDQSDRRAEFRAGIRTQQEALLEKKRERTAAQKDRRNEQQLNGAESQIDLSCAHAEKQEKDVKKEPLISEAARSEEVIDSRELDECGKKDQSKHLEPRWDLSITDCLTCAGDNMKVDFAAMLSESEGLDLTCFTDNSSDAAIHYSSQQLSESVLDEYRQLAEIGNFSEMRNEHREHSLPINSEVTRDGREEAEDRRFMRDEQKAYDGGVQQLLASIDPQKGGQGTRESSLESSTQIVNSLDGTQADVRQQGEAAERDSKFVDYFRAAGSNFGDNSQANIAKGGGAPQGFSEEQSPRKREVRFQSGLYDERVDQSLQDEGSFNQSTGSGEIERVASLGSFSREESSLGEALNRSTGGFSGEFGLSKTAENSSASTSPAGLTRQSGMGESELNAEWLQRLEPIKAMASREQEKESPQLALSGDKGAFDTVNTLLERSPLARMSTAEGSSQRNRYPVTSDGVDKKQAMEQIQRYLESRVLSSEDGKMVLQLYPDQLGSLMISMEQKDGDLLAHFMATTQITSQMLEASAKELSGAMLRQENIERVTIRVSVLSQEGSQEFQFDRKEQGQDEADKSQRQTLSYIQSSRLDGLFKFVDGAMLE